MKDCPGCNIVCSGAPFNLEGFVWIEGDKVELDDDAGLNRGKYPEELTEHVPVTADPNKVYNALQKQNVTMYDWFAADVESRTLLINIMLKMYEVCGRPPILESFIKTVKPPLEKKFIQRVFKNEPQGSPRGLGVICFYKALIQEETTEKDSLGYYLKNSIFNGEIPQTWYEESKTIPNVMLWSADEWKTYLPNWFVPTDPRNASFWGKKFKKFERLWKRYKFKESQMNGVIQWGVKPFSNLFGNKSTNDILNCIAFISQDEKSQEWGNRLGYSVEDNLKLIHHRLNTFYNNGNFAFKRYFSHVYHDAEPDDWGAVFLNRMAAKTLRKPSPREVVIELTELNVNQNRLVIQFPESDRNNYYEKLSHYNERQLNVTGVSCGKEEIQVSFKQQRIYDIALTIVDALAEKKAIRFKEDFTTAYVRTDFFSMLRMSGFSGYIDIVPHMYKLKKYDDDVAGFLRCFCGYDVVNIERNYVIRRKIPEEWQSYFIPVRTWILNDNDILITPKGSNVGEATSTRMEDDQIIKLYNKCERLPRRDMLLTLIKVAIIHKTRKNEINDLYNDKHTFAKMLSGDMKDKEKEVNKIRMKFRPNFSAFHLKDILNVHMDKPKMLYILGNHYTPDEWQIVMKQENLSSLTCTAYDKHNKSGPWPTITLADDKPISTDRTEQEEKPASWITRLLSRKMVNVQS